MITAFSGKRSRLRSPRWVDERLQDRRNEIEVCDGGRCRPTALCNDLSVILESASGEPQVWTRTHPTSKQRIVYAIQDGHDLGRSEPVRTLIARAIFWAANADET